MKGRRKIIRPRLRDYFRFEKNFSSLNNNLYFNTQVFNGFTFFSTLIGASAILGFFNPLFWSIAAATICLLIFLYQKTARLAGGVTVSRELKAVAREKSEFTISYLISNETAFPLQGIRFLEEFEGVEKGFFWVERLLPIPAHTQIRIKHSIFLNTGMGVKAFEPLKLNFRDDLGIFDFKVEFSPAPEVEVYPAVEETPALKNSISPESIEYGLYEIAKRGDSNLFIGTREYRHGDPVKHINWKLTKKTNKVVVNEYEKSTNTFVTLFMDLDLRAQSGLGEVSTWELAKDVALSICHNEIRKNNSVQVVASNMIIPFGSGKRQIELFEKHFTRHELNESKPNFFTAHMSELPARSQVYYLCPALLSPVCLETIAQLKRLKEDHHQVVIFILDPFKDLALHVQGPLRLRVLELHRQSETDFGTLKVELQRIGIVLLRIQPSTGLDFQKQFVAQALELMELK